MDIFWVYVCVIKVSTFERSYWRTLSFTHFMNSSLWKWSYGRGWWAGAETFLESHWSIAHDRLLPESDDFATIFNYFRRSFALPIKQRQLSLYALSCAPWVRWREARPQHYQIKIARIFYNLWATVISFYTVQLKFRSHYFADIQGA